ncbi:tetratricopeptide repeat protein [Nonomuraea rhodomycinica]|uniref:Tetratricopeptide repeat protein n=1 Tax=Nonomuraea rhodomycinica TaxID=1712872 RepID=A0A7Y6ILD4_9ACTN|nr:tetratricopeptide repeat protein [Nonomuraea rhodomycinica]NUW40275.1 tetratricopeptide repeat protein [Nonomuraea rhodomycinica]
MTSEQLAAAMKRWEEGDLGGAAVLFRQIAATGDPEASHLLACLLEEQGDLDGAEAAHRSVIQSGDPVFGQRSAIAMGMMLVAAREWPAAYRVLTIASDGADFEVAALADTALVLVLTELGDAAGATEALERARRCDSPAVAELAERLELPVFEWADPRTPWELYERAEGEEDYRELLICGDPEVVSLSAFRLYRIHADEGDFAAAREACEHAIAVGHPDHLTMAYKLLGAVLVDLGEYAESVEAYARAAEDPRPDVRLPALIEQAKVIAQLGDMAATRAIFERVIASGQRDYALEARACLAQLHTEAGEVDEALTALRAVFAAGESPWASVSATLLGMLLEQHPERREAIIELAGEVAGHPDQDAAFKAGLLLDHDARHRPRADPVEERALRDVDDAIVLLQDGRLAEARGLLRRAADSGAGTQAVRAMVALAQVELAEGDVDQADELLSYVAEGDDVVGGFTATFMLHLLRTPEPSGTGAHPVLRAILDHQRFGREEGLAGYRAATEHPDPAVAAVATAVLAQVLATTGYDVSEAGRLFRTAAGAGDPLALSYTALVYREILESRGEGGEAVELLRRARAEGHPVLAPWVGYALGGLLDGHAEGLAEARRAYEAALEGGHRGLRAEAAGALLRVLELQGDLLAAGRLHERLIAESGEGRAAARHALLLGLTRVRLDDLEGARAAFALVPPEGDAASASASVSTSGEEEAGLGRYARCLLDGDLAAAGRALARLSPDDGGPLGTLLGLECAHAWRRAGRAADAGALLALLLERGHPAYREQVACRLGAWRAEAEDWRGALAAWESAVREGAAPESAVGEGTDRESAVGEGVFGGGRGPAVVALTGMGRALHRLGDPEAAAEVLSRALGQAAGESEGGVAGAGEMEAGAGGVGESESGDLDPAARDARGAGGSEAGVGDAREVAEAAMLLARVLAELGREEEARALLDTLTGEAAPLYLATFLRDAGEVAAALAVAEEAAGSVPEDLAGWAARVLGAARAAAGDPDGARAAFERAAELEPDLAGEILLEGAHALAGAGDEEGARAAWRRAADLDGNPVVTLAARLRLGLATPEERPAALAATGDVDGALAALGELAGSTPSAGQGLEAPVGGSGVHGRRAEAAGVGGGGRDGAVGLSAAVGGAGPGGDGRDGVVRLGAAVDGAGAGGGGRGGGGRGGEAGLGRAYALVLEVARELGGRAGEALYRRVAERADAETAARARLGLGALLSGEGRHSHAELCLRPVIEALAPELAEAAWRGIAVARHGRGDLAGAAEALRAAMPATAVTLAGVLDDLGDAEGAGRALAAGAEAGGLASLRALMVHLVRHERHEAAEAQARRAVDTGDPETVVLGHRVRGACLRAAGDLRGAAAAYREGISAVSPDAAGGDRTILDPAGPDLAGLAPAGPSGAGSVVDAAVGGVRADLAAVLDELGDREAAAREARLAMASGDPDAVARAGLLLGARLRDAGDLHGAAEAFAAAAATPAAQARTAVEELEATARLAHEGGAHAPAVQALAAMGEHGVAAARELGGSCPDPGAVRSYYELAGSGPFVELDVAERLAELGRTAEARAMFERLHEHEDPGVRFAAGGRLLALLDAEGDADAFYRLAERQAGDADSPAPGVFGGLLGMLQERQGDTETALRTLREAAATGEPTALALLAQALVAAGEVDEGRRAYRRVLDAGDPDLAARAVIAIGETYHDEDEAEARSWYMRALDAEDGHTAAVAAMYLGALAKRARDYPEALGWYQRVIDAGDPESGMAAAHLGELCYWLGDRDGALRHYELTLTLTDRPDLVAEAAFRLGGIRYEHGDLATARRLLERAVATGDAAFAPQAAELLAKIG